MHLGHPKFFRFMCLDGSTSFSAVLFCNARLVYVWAWSALQLYHDDDDL